MYKDIAIDNNENIIFKKENLNFEIYEKNFLILFKYQAMVIASLELFQNIFDNYSILTEVAYNYNIFDQ